MDEEKADELFRLFTAVDAKAKQKRGLGFSSAPSGSSPHKHTAGSDEAFGGQGFIQQTFVAQGQAKPKSTAAAAADARAAAEQAAHARRMAADSVAAKLAAKAAELKRQKEEERAAASRDLQGPSSKEGRGSAPAREPDQRWQQRQKDRDQQSAQGRGRDGRGGASSEGREVGLRRESARGNAALEESHRRQREGSEAGRLLKGKEYERQPDRDRDSSQHRDSKGERTGNMDREGDRSRGKDSNYNRDWNGSGDRGSSRDRAVDRDKDRDRGRDRGSSRDEGRHSSRDRHGDRGQEGSRRSEHHERRDRGREDGRSREEDRDRGRDRGRGYADRDRGRDQGQGRGREGRQGGEDRPDSVAGRSRASAPAKAAVDYAALIPGYETMAPAERLKSRTRLALRKADGSSRKREREAVEDAVRDAPDPEAAVAAVAKRAWTRFVFDSAAPLEEEHLVRPSLEFLECREGEEGPAGEGTEGANGGDWGPETAAVNTVTFRQSSKAAARKVLDSKHEAAIFGGDGGGGSNGVRGQGTGAAASSGAGERDDGGSKRRHGTDGLASPGQHRRACDVGFRAQGDASSAGAGSAAAGQLPPELRQLLRDAGGEDGDDGPVFVMEEELAGVLGADPVSGPGGASGGAAAGQAAGGGLDRGFQADKALMANVSEDLLQKQKQGASWRQRARQPRG